MYVHVNNGVTVCPVASERHVRSHVGRRNVNVRKPQSQTERRPEVASPRRTRWASAHAAARAAATRQYVRRAVITGCGARAANAGLCIEHAIRNDRRRRCGIHVIS